MKQSRQRTGTAAFAAFAASPLLWSKDVGRLLAWATATLGLVESWRAEDEQGSVEHAELLWRPDATQAGNRITISWSREQYAAMGPSGIALRVAAASDVDEVHALALKQGVEIIQGPEESPVAYSFTARDPDGNQWWVNAETGLLDDLRAQSARPSTSPQ